VDFGSVYLGDRSHSNDPSKIRYYLLLFTKTRNNLDKGEVFIKFEKWLKKA